MADRPGVCGGIAPEGRVLAMPEPSPECEDGDQLAAELAARATDSARALRPMP